MKQGIYSILFVTTTLFLTGCGSEQDISFQEINNYIDSNNYILTHSDSASSFGSLSHNGYLRVQRVEINGIDDDQNTWLEYIIKYQPNGLITHYTHYLGSTDNISYQIDRTPQGWVKKYYHEEFPGLISSLAIFTVDDSGKIIEEKYSTGESCHYRYDGNKLVNRLCTLPESKTMFTYNVNNQLVGDKTFINNQTNQAEIIYDKNGIMAKTSQEYPVDEQSKRIMTQNVIKHDQQGNWLEYINTQTIKSLQSDTFDSESERYIVKLTYW